MNELIFLVQSAPEGGYTARALGQSIFTEGDTLDDLRDNIRDAVACHYDEGAAPSALRLHIVREEVLAASGFPATDCSQGWPCERLSHSCAGEG